MKVHIGMGLEMLAFAIVLGLANIGLLYGAPLVDGVLVPSAVRAGEWQRLWLHPWVHVSGYHLCLDASAFLTLFFMLDRTRMMERWGIVGGAWAGALVVVWWAEPRVEVLGLCGLSGMAHGLFAAVAVQCQQGPGFWSWAAWSLLAVCAKTGLEVVAGQPLFMGLHAGAVGQPLILCHAGGLLGGVCSALLASRCAPGSGWGRQRQPDDVRVDKAVVCR